MLAQKSVKLSEYKPYPFFINSIFLDFNIFKDYVLVDTLMTIKPKLKASSKLILKGKQIQLLSILINGKELNLEEYILSENELIIISPPFSEFKLEIKSKIDPFVNT